MGEGNGGPLRAGLESELARGCEYVQSLWIYDWDFYASTWTSPGSSIVKAE